MALTYTGERDRLRCQEHPERDAKGSVIRPNNQTEIHQTTKHSSIVPENYIFAIIVLLALIKSGCR